MAFQIPMSSPDLTDAERQAVQSVLNTPILSMGHWITDFEKSFCDLTGAKHAVGVSSGTAGLHLCVRAAGIGEGDLVITTPFSFVASANVMLYENAVPVFVDVNPKTGNIDPELVSQAARDLIEGGKKAEKWLPRKGSGTKRTTESDSASGCLRSARGPRSDSQHRESIPSENDRGLMRSARRGI